MKRCTHLQLCAGAKRRTLRHFLQDALEQPHCGGELAGSGVGHCRAERQLTLERARLHRLHLCELS